MSELSQDDSPAQRPEVPILHKDLSEKTDELSSKHIRKCAFYLSPYQYSDRKRGRPKAVSVIEELDLRGDMK